MRIYLIELIANGKNDKGKIGHFAGKEREVLELIVHEKKKITEIYLTKSEQQDPELRMQLQNVFVRFRKAKYTVAVFESGDQDLYESTLALLAWNKRRSAEKAVQEAKGLAAG